MLVIPAIDIRGSKCVRLTQGDFTKEKIYSEDPVSIATQWEKEGAKLIHVVDLDGAKNGYVTNIDVIKQIAQTVTIPIQVGGGVRNKETIKTVLSLGVSRVILGTVAINDKDELKSIVEDFSSQIIIALDSKNGKLMKQGWLEESDQSSITTALTLKKLGIQRFIYTDVIQDGTLSEPNYEEIEKLVKNVNIPTTAAGGIASIEQIKKLKQLGAEAVIIGKALYEGEINLKEALLC